MSNTVKIVLAGLVLGLGIAAAWRFRKTPQPLGKHGDQATAGLVLRKPGSAAGPPWTHVPQRATPQPRSAKKRRPKVVASAPAPPPAPPMPVPRFPMMGPVIHRKPVGAADNNPKDPAACHGRSGWITHSVSPGDTLEGLAARYLGDPRRAGEVLAANRYLIRNPRFLPIGAILRIPHPREGGSHQAGDLAGGGWRSVGE